MKRHSAVGILIQDGRVLLLKRHADDKALPGKLCLPGGKVEKGEHMYQAMIREFVEETGITVTKYKFLDSKESDRFYIHFYVVEADNYSVTLSDEHESYLWLDKAEMDAQQDQFGPITYQVISEYYPYLVSNSLRYEIGEVW